MLRIGLTGGIGSGKSTVTAIFEIFGIPVYKADDAAKRVMNEDRELKKSIIRHFGADSYLGGTLNRKHLSSIVFQDSEKLRLLNSLVHPATIADSVRWMNSQKGPYAIKEAALIFETGQQQGLDFVIGVFAPEAIRIARTMSRDHLTREEVLSRMSKQMNESRKISLCQFVVRNDEQTAVLPQVEAIHQELLRLASKK